VPVLDVAIIGAGMAGLAAARRVTDAGRTALLLEARDRIGGRAWTRPAEGLALDQGCHWFHSADRNPLVPLARSLGMAVEEYGELWARPWNKRKLGAREAEANAAWQRLEAAMAAVTASGRDRPLSDLIAAEPVWGRFMAAAYSWSAGDLPERLSTLDLASGLETHTNWRTPDGLGSMVQRFGAGLPLQLECPVERVALARDSVRLSGTWGSVEARASIVTLPTNVLAAGGIVFEPALPQARLAALADLPLGVNEKVFLKVAGTPFGPPRDFQANLTFERVDCAHFHIQEFGRPLVEAYYGGPYARELAEAGPAAMAEAAVAELVGEFGSALRPHLSPLVATRWFDDPWTRGSYAYARPDGAGARALIAQPLEGRLFFAGEATSLHSSASLHGAYETGLRAADEALAALA